MLFKHDLTTTLVLAAFTDEVAARRGKVTDTFDDGRRLYARSVHSRVEDVQPGDQIRGGVALKATGEAIWLYPYLFRIVCSNGAIMVQTLDARSIADSSLGEPDAVLQAVRDGVAAFSAEEMFSAGVRATRISRELDATATDAFISIVSILSKPSAGGFSDLLSRVMDQFLKEGDQSLFGLANAITATARDVQDPDLKWDLEALGGAVTLGTVSPIDVEQCTPIVGPVGRSLSVSGARRVGPPNSIHEGDEYALKFMVAGR